MKYKKFQNLSLIERKRNPINSRIKKIRLEKNERVSNFSRDFLKKIKFKFKSEYISAYPEVEEIYKLLAKQLFISPDKLVLTAGSDLAIKNCFELLISPGDEVITLDPTYGMVDVYCKLFEAKQIKIKYNKNLILDEKKLIKSINGRTKFVIIANPNSPTGTIIDQNNLLKIVKTCKKYNCYILVDECYFGYYSKSLIKYVKKFNNLIISRSFSKIGLAGCRVGYLVASKKTSKMLYKFRPFYEISHFSCLVLKLILKNKKIINDYIKDTLLGKKILIENLKRLNLNFFFTNTNFILIKFKTKKIKESFIKIFLKNNILVMGENKLPEGKKILRITLGPESYMKKVIKIIEKNYKQASNY